MISDRFRQHIPEHIKSLLGSDNKVCIISGSAAFRYSGDLPFIIMGCNPRIKHVIPGIMRAAEELDALVAFELSATEGGLDGGYTGQTPEIFSQNVIEYAESVRFSKPFIIHADHVTIKSGADGELAAAGLLIDAQLKAGYTSFAIDASFNPIKENITIVSKLLSRLQDTNAGVEVELGEVTPVGRESNLTTVDDVEEFLGGLSAKGIHPHLLAIDNGSKSGNYLDGQLVNIDLQRTGEIFETAKRFGLSGLVQHGITGTPLRIVGKLADYGIRKGNIGTLWQNVAHAGLPPDLVDEMRDWSRSQKRDIKYATRVFIDSINSIPAEDRKLIADLAYREAKEFITAFQAKGSVSRLAETLKNV
ncbi:MAG: class II fructose-bisphosphate aldolase [Geobacteraceae bacterium]|nr:class II fructose-bisphosphate aldolase [Geobacteraceae bacterium]